MTGKGEAAAQHREAEEDGEMVGVVKLISAEGFEFVIDKKAAMVSNTLRNMLTSPGIPSSYPSFHLPINRIGSAIGRLVLPLINRIEILRWLRRVAR
jgi:hypothetical protein